MKLLQILKAKANAYRNTLRIVESQEFLAVYESASKAEKDKAELFAMEGNFENLKIWINEQAGFYTVTQLRRQAQAAGIPNYSRLDREDLIRALYTGGTSDSTL